MSSLSESTESGPAGRFVVLATPRSGSNWLCTLLDSHPEILCHHELFNEDGVHLALSVRDGGLDLGSLELQRSEPLELLRRAWAQSLGHTLVGFKLNVGQSKQAFEAVLDEPDIAKILVSRRNRIRAFLSEQIAERTGVWESYPHSRKAGDPGPQKIDRVALEAHAKRNADYLKGLNDRLSGSGQRAFHVAYEDIQREKAHQRLLEFLGVDSTISLKGQTRKMNPGHLRDRIANYDELKNALRGSVFAADLETDNG